MLIICRLLTNVQVHVLGSLPGVTCLSGSAVIVRTCDCSALPAAMTGVKFARGCLDKVTHDCHGTHLLGIVLEVNFAASLAGQLYLLQVLTVR